MKGQDAIKEIFTHKFDNCIVRVHIPDLTEEERSKRKNELHKVAELFFKEQIRKGVVISEKNISKDS